MSEIAWTVEPCNYHHYSESVKYLVYMASLVIGSCANRPRVRMSYSRLTMFWQTNCNEILVFCFELLKIKSKIKFTNTRSSLGKMASKLLTKTQNKWRKSKECSRPAMYEFLHR